MAGVFRPWPPPPRLVRRGATLLDGGPPSRVATSTSTLDAVAGAATALVRVRLSGSASLAVLASLGTISGSTVRLAVGASLLGPIGSSAAAATGLWTSWRALRVTLVPAALWDGGASVWDGGLTPEDNDGAVWDAGSGFAMPSPIPASAWLAAPPVSTTWENSLR